MRSLTDFLREIDASSGELSATVIQFRASVTAAAAVSYPTDGPGQTFTLSEEYVYFITELRAGFTLAGLTENAGTADTLYADVDDFRFNIKDSGSGKDLFDTDVELNTLVSGDGKSTPISFAPSGWAIRAGATLKLTVTMRDTAITRARVVTPQLVCIKVPKGYSLKAS